MGIFDETVEVARRTMVLFFLIDASGSMSGDKMGTLNNTMEGVVRELEDISNDNADAELEDNVKEILIDFANKIKRDDVELDEYEY